MQTLGPGKARVQVKADLNVDKTSKQQVTIDGKVVPRKETTESEKLKGGNATAGGSSGTAGNIPQYSAGAAGGGANSNYKRKSKTVENDVPKTITKTDVAPGAVNRLNVALVVDKTVPAADFAAVQKAVQGAAGIDKARGDVFQAAQIPFAKAPAAPKAGPVPVTMLGPLKWVGLGLATLLFMFFMSRQLKRREGEALASPSWLTDIEQPVSLAELEAPMPARAEHPTVDAPAAPAGHQRAGARAADAARARARRRARQAVDGGRLMAATETEAPSRGGGSSKLGGPGATPARTR